MAFGVHGRSVAKSVAVASNFVHAIRRPRGAVVPHAEARTFAGVIRYHVQARVTLATATTPWALQRVASIPRA